MPFRQLHAIVPCWESTMDYDCFLSHNSKDKPAVRELCVRLQEAGLKVWFDENELPFGYNWQPLLEDGIRRSAAGVVVIGPNGTSNWNAEEMELMLRDARRQVRPVIPLLLSGAPSTPDLPGFLLNRTLCNLGDDPDGIAFEKLVRDLLKLRGDTSDPNPVTPPTGNDMSTDYLSQSDADSPNVKNPETVLYSGDRLSLNFQDIEVRAVLQVLGEFTGLNFVASDTVCGSITLRLKNVPWDQALDIVLNSKGLAMRQTGNVIMVAPVTEVAAQERLDLQSRAQIEELAPLCFEFIQIKYRKASDLAALIKSEGANLLSEHGSIIADQLTDTLLVRDTVSKLERIRGLVTRLDIPVRHG
ncbi:hypothetical protein THSYN_27220 [Candidatus Thiodictyon syntrophicum]|uniref:TIR domain-containing protein n=1 Tax=Candidatus Thiodictyon syntrophicum TaxID=1166950 RepID=A0A2K8UFD1_9GAMM|nr:hypothetical protein THSYN_27220 [Candidatus Thiodictyon syntrophicum]